MSRCAGLWLRALMIAGLSLFLATPGHAEARHAFVVGVDTYTNLQPEFQLERPAADAEGVAGALDALGYRVTLLSRVVPQETLLRRLTAFVSAIQPGDTAVFYFAGHGIALENTNYLLPSDIPALEAGQELLARTRSLSETDVRQLLRDRGARVVVMIIDACRNNPFPRSNGTRSLGAARGLVPAEPADGVFTLYSAALGQQALDRLPGHDTDRNSVFTRVLLTELRKPDQNLIDLGESVRDSVSALAESANLKQNPAYYNEVRGARRIFLAGLPDGTGGTAGPRQEAPPSVQPPSSRPASPEPPRAQAALPPGSPAGYFFPTGLDPAGDNWLALRSEPNGRGVRIRKMGPETLMTVLGRQGAWAYVRLQSGETGWAHAGYLACCRTR